MHVRPIIPLSCVPYYLRTVYIYIEASIVHEIGRAQSGRSLPILVMETRKDPSLGQVMVLPFDTYGYENSKVLLDHEIRVGVLIRCAASCAAYLIVAHLTHSGGFATSLHMFLAHSFPRSRPIRVIYLPFILAARMPNPSKNDEPIPYGDRR